MNKYDLKVLQINFNYSQYATESTLQYTVENNISLILVKKPWLVKNNNYSRSINHQGFIQIKPNSSTLRPRVWVYAAKNQLFDINISNISPIDLDLLIIDIINRQNNCQLINIYNQLD